MIHVHLFVLAIVLSNACLSQDWESVLQLNKPPRCFFLDSLEGDLYIGGHFYTANDIEVCRIFKLESNNGIQALSCGFDCSCLDGANENLSNATFVNSITKFEGKVYATGFFFNSNLQTVNSLSEYSNSSWNGMGTGLISGQFTGGGSMLKVIDNKLFLVGSFSSVAGVECTSISKFQNAQWSNAYNFPSSISISSITDVEIYNDEIYVIGSFFSSNEDSIAINRIAKFDGNNWVGVGNGIPGGVSSAQRIIKFQNKLYVIGRMLKNSGDPGDGIASWDGQQWNEVGGGLNNSSSNPPTNFDAVVFKDKLYVVGDFTSAGGQAINNIASWDGENWCGLGVMPNTFDNRVTNIIVHDGNLIIGGAFQSINGDSTLKYIAKYVGPDVYEPCGNATSIENELSDDVAYLYPNPTNGIFSIDFNEDFTGSFAIYNYLGQQVQSIQSQKKIQKYQFDLSGESSGIYFLVVYSETEASSKAYKIIKR